MSDTPALDRFMMNGINEAVDIAAREQARRQAANVHGFGNKVGVIGLGTMQRTADILGMQGVSQFAHNAINKLGEGADFGQSILQAGQERIRSHARLMAALGKKAGDNISTSDVARSMLYNKEGKLMKGRIGAAIAGAYMGANLIGHGSLGIPFISSASWNR